MSTVNRKSVTGHWQHKLERDRELTVRTIPCPQPDCNAGVDEKCLSDNTDAGNAGNWYSQWSHTGRYLAAVAAGLVPPLPT